MGFEIPLDVDYIDHPKTLRLIAALGKLADVYPLRLWCWCAKYAKDGIVRGGAQELEKAVRWTGESGKCHKAMVDAGFLNRDGKTVHDWQIHAGRKIKQYERKKALQRQKYADDSDGDIPDSSENLPADCRNSSTMQGGSLPPLNETKRNETKLDQTKTNETAGVSELSPEWLARIWVDQCQAKINRSKRDKVEDVSVQFAEWIRSKIPASEIAAEMEKPDRDRTELLWQFKKRLAERLASRPNKDDFNARLLEEMRKEGHVK